jgi:hypothetical protein
MPAGTLAFGMVTLVIGGFTSIYNSGAPEDTPASAAASNL